MFIQDIRNRAHKFISTYKDVHKENAEAQSFLNDFFEIFGIPRRRVASFEYAVQEISRGTKRIDLFWPSMLLVEMKSRGESLPKALDQAIGYLKGLKNEDLPRYVLVCDFNRFLLKDLEAKLGEGEYEFELADLLDNLDLFSFMLGKEMQDLTEYQLNEQAALLLAELYDELQQAGFSGHDLQIFMVRILFCMFAEDTGIFNPRQFIKYLMNFTNENGIDTDLHLYKIFQVLDTPYEKRNKNLPEEQAEFPYVNGHLFSERLDMPSFNRELRQTLLECCYFNWKDVSPAIFGSLFQSIMDKEQRRDMGAHYTSEENILKVLEPLLLSDLQSQLSKIISLKNERTRKGQLVKFIDQLRTLTFLDPACGCGNFLIITYRELRKLELKALQAQSQGSMSLELEIQPAIPLQNFYGIEIDEWPARIAEVAMWLTQHQMNVEFAKEFGEEPDLLPLVDYAHIHHDNALTLDWEKVVPAKSLNYIIGNPPFVGSKYQSSEQKAFQLSIWGKAKGAKQLDYVANWFYKAALFMVDTSIEGGLVSTNSICMGEQVATLWGSLLELGIKINFAHRTFIWENEASDKASVHCIIIGFSHKDKEPKLLFDYPNLKGQPVLIKAKNINPYLIDAPDLIVGLRTKALNAKNPMWFGNMPLDGGFLLLSPKEKEALIEAYPDLEKWIKPLLGAREFLNNQDRYCLWFADASTKELRELSKITPIQERIEGVKAMRLGSSDAGTRKHAETPWRFRDTRVSPTYILVPSVSSERRKYVPMGFFSGDVISTNLNLVIPNGSLYEFGILNSEMHMDWLRATGGRMKSDYRYSATLVYNNFPWPTVTEKDKERVSKLAQAVLNARQEEFDRDSKTSLADLYDPDLMPLSLRKAHTELDKAVEKLYSSKKLTSALERTNLLFKLYQQLI